MTAKNRAGTHSDGFAWRQGMTSDPRAHTLVNPEGWPVAHVHRCDDRTWRVIEDLGLDGARVLDGTDGLPTVGAAMAAADNHFRPCAWMHPLPDGQCDLERAPGSVYCETHAERSAREQATSDDMDRMQDA